MCSLGLLCHERPCRMTKPLARLRSAKKNTTSPLVTSSLFLQSSGHNGFHDLLRTHYISWLYDRSPGTGRRSTVMSTRNIVNKPFPSTLGVAIKHFARRKHAYQIMPSHRIRRRTRSKGSRSPAFASSPFWWNPAAVLRVLNPATGRLTCPVADDENRRCGRSPNTARRGRISSRRLRLRAKRRDPVRGALHRLTKGAVLDGLQAVRGKRTRRCLERLARALMCRFHRESLGELGVAEVR
jgi:hypothetical protein